MEETETTPTTTGQSSDMTGRIVIERLCDQIKYLQDRLNQQENTLTSVLVESKTREANYEVRTG